MEIGSKLSEAKLAKAAENLSQRGIFDPDELPQVSVVNDDSMPYAKLVIVSVKEMFTGFDCMDSFRVSRSMIKRRPIPQAYTKLTCQNFVE